MNEEQMWKGFYDILQEESKHDKPATEHNTK